MTTIRTRQFNTTTNAHIQLLENVSDTGRSVLIPPHTLLETPSCF